MEILTLENLGFTYPVGQKKALCGVDAAIEAGSFVLVCGPTGCGKSTLLRLCKPSLAPTGQKEGRVLLNGREDDAALDAAVGFVGQDVHSQIVTDRVWHELSFPLECRGLPEEEIARRVAEVGTYFGLGPLFHQSTHVLSGGQKQRLALACAMAAGQKILVLDEPTSQLDPVAAGEFLSLLHRLCRETGVTVLLCEHRLEVVYPLCDKVLFLKNGACTYFGAPGPGVESAPEALIPALPCAARTSLLLQKSAPHPLTLAQGRDMLKTLPAPRAVPLPALAQKGEVALRFSDVWFRYEKNEADVLRALDLSARAGEITCLLGQNGAGKSTMLRLACGALRPQVGSVRLLGKPAHKAPHATVALLPQDASLVFTRETVGEDLAGLDLGFLPYDTEKFWDAHPYDLSGGERQLCALAKVLALRPKVLLLDEPTIGVDGAHKALLAALLRELAQSGLCIVLVSHDCEFAARVADRCCLFFAGQATLAEPCHEFFTKSTLFTTQAARMAQGIVENAITPEEIAAAFGGGAR